ELKLETPTHRYWLCTKGLSEPTPGLPDNWVVNYVTREKRGAKNGEWDMHAYGPDQLLTHQEIDYMNILRQEIDRLEAEQAQTPSSETARSLDETLKEFVSLAERLRQMKQP